MKQEETDDSQGLILEAIRQKKDPFCDHKYLQA